MDNEDNKVFIINEKIPDERRYYQCIIKCGMISYGWINFLIVINTIATTFLGAFKESHNYSESVHNQIALGQIITGAMAISLLIIKQYVINNIKHKEKLLKLKEEPQLHNLRLEEVPVKNLSCVRRYYHCIITCGKITYGWINFFIMCNTIATTFLGAFNDYDKLSETMKNRIALGQIITGTTAISLIVLKQYIINNIKFKEKALKYKEMV